MLKPVSCDHVTSFNYDGKKARDIGLTCWCNRSNIMPDSIFRESMRQEVTYFFFFFFFLGGWYFYFLQNERWKRWSQFCHYNISGRGEILSCNGLRQIGLISLQWDLKSETCQGISELELHCGVPLSLYGVMFLTRYVAFLFNKICLGLLPTDSYATLDPGNRLLITWVNMTYQIKDRYLPSIHFWDNGPW